MKKVPENKDMAQFITIENKSKVDLHGLSPGQRAKIEVDDKGTPIDYHWRRRLKDSAIDNSVSIIEETQPVEAQAKAKTNVPQKPNPKKKKEE